MQTDIIEDQTNLVHLEQAKTRGPRDHEQIVGIENEAHRLEIGERPRNARGDAAGNLEGPDCDKPRAQLVQSDGVHVEFGGGNHTLGEHVKDNSNRKVA